MSELAEWLVLVVLLLAVFFFFGRRFWVTAQRLIIKKGQSFWEKQLPHVIQEQIYHLINDQSKRNPGLKASEFVSNQVFQKELDDIVRRLAALEKKHAESAPDHSMVLEVTDLSPALDEASPSPNLTSSVERKPETDIIPEEKTSDPEPDRFSAQLDNLRPYLETKGENGQQLYKELKERGYHFNLKEKLDCINRLFQLATVREQKDKIIKHYCEKLFDLYVESPPLGDNIPPSMTDFVRTNYLKSLTKDQDLLNTIEEFWRNNKIEAGRVCFVLEPIVREPDSDSVIPSQEGLVVLY